MKKFFALAAAMAIPFAAFAGDYEDPCGGNQCYDAWENVSLGGSANFGGFGGSYFEGDEGYNLIEKGGSGSTNLTLSIGGDLCGPDCQDGGFQFEAQASEWVTVQTGALGSQSGVPVTAINEGGAFSGVTFQMGTTLSGGHHDGHH